MYVLLLLIPSLALIASHHSLSALLPSESWLPWIGSGFLVFWSALLMALVLWTEPRQHPHRPHPLHGPHRRGGAQRHSARKRLRLGIPADSPLGDLRRASPADRWVGSGWFHMNGAPLAMPGFPLPPPAAPTDLEWVARRPPTPSPRAPVPVAPSHQA